VVAFPTETVSGVGARADLPEAVARLLAVKGREAEKKMAVLVAGIEGAERLVGALPATARRIAERWWPGPVTIVVPAAGGETLGMRCPALEVTRRMVGYVGAPVFAPSANPSGLAPALSAEEVLGYFEGRIDAVLDGGRVEIGEASTVVRVGAGGVEVLREGAVPAEEIRQVAAERP
jgi:L-threonylcarbamoyladenylate synthase